MNRDLGGQGMFLSRDYELPSEPKSLHFHESQRKQNGKTPTLQQKSSTYSDLVEYTWLGTRGL